MDKPTPHVPTFPVLSYSQSFSDPARFIQSLRDALQTTGFFHLTDIEPIIPTWSQDFDAIFRDCESFFELGEEEKDKIAMRESRHFRGWSKTGVERTQGKIDWREQIDFGPETLPLLLSPAITDNNPIELNLYGPNQFPPQPPTFQISLERYRGHCDIVAERLLEMIARSALKDQADEQELRLFTSLFGIDTSHIRTEKTRRKEEEEDFLDPAFAPPYSRLKVVRYPPLPSHASGILGVGPHKDGGALTLLAQDMCGGLEVQMWDGKWVGVEPREHGLVINVGQVIERLTSSVFPATTHRVLPTLGPKPRYSIPFFYSPLLVAKIQPVPLSLLHTSLLPSPPTSSDSDPSHDLIANRQKIITEVTPGDLHEEVFGRAAWRGITRSHGDVWKKYYGREIDSLGGPQVF